MCPTPGSRPQIVLTLTYNHIWNIVQSDAIINASSNFNLLKFDSECRLHFCLLYPDLLEVFSFCFGLHPSFGILYWSPIWFNLLSTNLKLRYLHFGFLFCFRQSRPPAARTSSTGSLGSESAALSALSLDSLVAPDTPIQFDIISPVSEDLPGQAKSSGQSGR